MFRPVLKRKKNKPGPQSSGQPGANPTEANTPPQQTQSPENVGRTTTKLTLASDASKAPTEPEPSSPSATAAACGGRKWAYRLAAMVLAPVLFFGALELVLGLFGYGYPTSFFKPMRIGNEDYLVENDKFGLRFFPPELARSPAPVVMKAH